MGGGGGGIHVRACRVAAGRSSVPLAWFGLMHRYTLGFVVGAAVTAIMGGGPAAVQAQRSASDATAPPAGWVAFTRSMDTFAASDSVVGAAA